MVAPAWAAPLLGRMPEVRARIDAPFKRREAGLAARWRLGRSLQGRYGKAYVMPGSWKSALVPFFAGIPRRIGQSARAALRPDQRHRAAARRAEAARPRKPFSASREGGSFRAPQLDVDAGNQATLLARIRADSREDSSP